MAEPGTELAASVRAAVEARREDAVRLLQEPVRIPSVTGRQGAGGEIAERA